MACTTAAPAAVLAALRKQPCAATASHDELVPLADTQRLVAKFPPGVATLRVFEGTDHNSVSGDAELWEAIVTGR